MAVRQDGRGQKEMEGSEFRYEEREWVSDEISEIRMD